VLGDEALPFHERDAPASLRWEPAPDPEGLSASDAERKTSLLDPASAAERQHLVIVCVSAVGEEQGWVHPLTRSVVGDLLVPIEIDFCFS